jgi:hypothetical protein
MAASGSIGRLRTRVSTSLGRLKPSGGAKRRKGGAGASDAAGAADHAATGGIAVGYAPERDGDADPGEVVWAWVPYEDDPSQGKDRPVLIIGHDGPQLVGVPLSSKDHAGRRDGGDWVSVGRGAWDREGRESYADASRLLRFDQGGVRREGSALHRDRFDEVLAHVRELHDWGR